MIHEIKHKIKQVVSRARNRDTKYRSNALHIDDFRKDDFRVFRALRYFGTHLGKEIDWNRENLEKLKIFKEKPEEFYNQFMTTSPDKKTDTLQQHYQKHVVEGYDIHKKFMETHSKRFDTVKELIPLSTYEKLVKISVKYGGIPDYFVYDKKRHEVFFVVENPSDSTQKWSEIVKRNNIADVVFLKKY